MASKNLIAKVSHNLFPFPICLGAAENVGRVAEGWPGENSCCGFL